MKTGLSPALNEIALGMAALVMFTSSFDIFLVLQAGGNFRFCQFCVPPLLALAVLCARRAGVVPTLGAKPLLLWLAFLVIFIPNSGFWPKSVGYCLWLVLNVALMFSFVQLFSASEGSTRRLLRLYCSSFSSVAAFGIAQFLLPLFGYSSPLVTQWWIRDALARVNGLSYEPSYFATYLLIGSVLVRSLHYKRVDLLSRRAMRVLSLTITAGIVLSSSRMGILFLILDAVSYRLAPWIAFCRDLLHARIRVSNLRALIPSFAWAGGAALLVFGFIQVVRVQPLLVLMFLGGTGISGATAHSVVQRESAFSDTLAAFTASPLIGRSLGGVSFAIAGLHGASVSSFEDTKAFEGMSVFAEVLAASGIIGIMPFLWFLVTTIVKPFKAATASRAFDSAVLRGLLRSLVFTWAILQFNQNILRPYVWVHLAVLATVYAQSSCLLSKREMSAQT